MYEDEYDDAFDEEVDDLDDSVELVPCPSCGEMIYEEAEQCPECGEYIVHSTSPWQGKPYWWILLGAFGVLVTMVALALL